jgi:hypothetical protein
MSQGACPVPTSTILKVPSESWPTPSKLTDFHLYGWAEGPCATRMFWFHAYRAARFGVEDRL